MQKITSLIAGLLFCGAALQVTAQRTPQEIKAEKYFKGLYFVKAIEKYEGVEALTFEGKRNLADSYRYVGELKKAEELYSQIAHDQQAQPDDLLLYSNILRMHGKYPEANQWMMKFHDKSANDSRGMGYKKIGDQFDKITKDQGNYTIKNLDVNSEQSDFGATFYSKDQVVFASSREGTVMIRRKWSWNQLPFLNLYVADKAENSQLSNLEQLDKKVNAKFHEGPAVFTADGNKMYFTRNNYDSKSDDDAINLMLFESSKEGDKWSKPLALPFNDRNYSVGHASLSKDGKWLYFASDMPGGKGGSDIYKAEIKTDGTYGPAINLGDKINTEGQEMFPFVHPDGMLFFSSDGLVGLGGLDVFVAQIKPDDAIGKVMNLGYPLNDRRDDFSLILDENQKKGYFSSNRPGGKGDDDIYAFDLLKPFTFGKTIKGTAKDTKGNILAMTMIALMDDQGNVVDTVTTAEDGTYSFSVDADKEFQLTGNKEKYFEGMNTASTKTDDDVVIADVALEKDPGLSLYCLITEHGNGTPIEGVKIKLLDNMTGSSEDLVTPATGDFRKPLTEKKLNDRVSYNLVIEAEGYLSKTVTYNAELDREGQFNIHEALDITLDKIEVGADLAKIIDIKPIYFNLGKSNIRKDAAIELDKIVKVMNENPSMVVELGSHTDCRGSAASNERLSDRRAKSSAKYVQSKITNPERIYGKGYGENVLVNDCACEGRTRSDCDEERHQANRRTEFKIIKM